MKTRFRTYCFYLVVFAAAPCLLLMIYAAMRVYPFGQNSVLTLDLNAQYIYYYEAFRDAFLGDRSLLYSFSRTLGGEMMGLYAYYLASPFSLVLLVFPKTLITEAILCMILLKVGTAALTFAVYLRRSRKTKPAPAFLFSLMYGLMSYMVVQAMNPMWLDGPILLPLILLAVEDLVDNGRYSFFVVSLAALFVANFYIGYMTGLFALLYFLCYLSASDAELKASGKVRRFRTFAGASLLSLGGSMWLLLPTYYSLKMGKFGFTSPDFAPRQQVDPFDLLCKMLPATYDSVNYHGYPFIYCGLLTLMLLTFYFNARSIPLKKKSAAALLIGVLMMCFMVSTLDTALHGFQRPVWLNCRYSFVLSFFLLTFAYEGYTAVKDIDRTAMVRICLALLLLTAFIGRAGYEFIEPEVTIWLTYAFLIAYTVLLSGLRKSTISPDPDLDFRLFKSHATRTVSRHRVGQIVLVLIVSLELLVNAYAMLIGAHKEVHFSDRKSYRDYFDRLYVAVDYLELTDNGFYRTETVLRRTVNDPMALGINGISHSSSTLNSKVIDLLCKLGFSSREHWTRYKGATILTDSLLGIKYVISEEAVNNRYEPVFTQNGVTVYKNPYALPVALAAHRDYASVTLDSPDPFVNQNALLSSILGRPYEEFFKLLPVNGVVFENMTATEAEDCVCYSAVDPGENAHIEYILGTAGENEMYMYLYSEYPRKVNLWKDHEYLDTFFDYESVCIMPLGSNPGKETISLITTPTEDEYCLNQNMFYYLDTPLFETAMAELEKDKAEVERISETKLRLVVEAKEDDILFTSIPYEEGWSVRVNGKKAQTFCAAQALLAVELGPGRQVVEMRFIPSGLVPGSLVSLAAWTLFAGLLIARRRADRRRPPVFEPPPAMVHSP